MSEETTPTMTMEQELEALRTSLETPPTTPAPDAAQPAPPATPPATPETPLPGSPETTTPTLDDRLKAIEDAPAPAEPKLTDEQAKVLEIVPTVAALQQINQSATYFNQLSQLVAARDFAAVESMFDPAALQDWHEHIYQKFVADRESDWVGRWIAEHEGTAPVHNGMKALQAKIDALQQRISARDQAEQSQQHQVAQQQLAHEYGRHLESLFDKIEFSKTDRPFVAAVLKSKIESNPSALAEVRAGRMTAINPLFKAAVREYVQRDQTTATTTAANLKAQEQHKPLIPASPVNPTGNVTDEMIASAPKDARESLLDRQMNEQLNELAASMKRGRK